MDIFFIVPSAFPVAGYFICCFSFSFYGSECCFLTTAFMIKNYDFCLINYIFSSYSYV